MKKIAIIIFLLSGVSSTYAQTKINWMSIEEAYAKNLVKPKKTVIDVYTSWCGWCKVMDRETFTNADVVKYINDNYYAVKLDAESTKDIKIGGTVYKYDPANRANNAAIQLLKGQMSYPSLVYLDEKFNMIQPVPGYMKANEFHQLITYFGGNYHKKEPYENYQTVTYPKLFAKKTM